MNILQISTGYFQIPPTKGGPQDLVIYNISKNLVKLGNDVTIIDRKYSKTDNNIEYIKGIKIIRIGNKLISLSVLDKTLDKIPYCNSLALPINYLLFSIINGSIFFISINNYIKKNIDKFDVIHVHVVSLGFLLILFNRDIRKKMIYTAHHSIPELERGTISILDKILLKIEFFLKKRVKKITVVNPYYRLKIIQQDKIDPNDVISVPNGVDITEFSPIRKERNNKEITILYVGKIISIKGIEYLIDAIDIIINKNGYKNVSLILVGNNDLTTGYEKFILKKIYDLNLMKNIRFIPSVSKEYLKELYSNCDIFVLPSIAESFGLVITEAMASGKPVIATKTAGAMTQIVDGMNGFLVQPKNAGQLSEKIKYFIDHSEERELMGKCARRQAEENFDWNEIAKKYLDVYFTVKNNTNKIHN